MYSDEDGDIEPFAFVGLTAVFGETSAARDVDLDSDGVITVLDARAVVMNSDKILCYGLEEALGRLSQRECGEAGDRDHMLAIRRQRLRLVEEKVEDQQREMDAPLQSAER